MQTAVACRAPLRAPPACAAPQLSSRFVCAPLALAPRAAACRRRRGAALAARAALEALPASAAAKVQALLAEIANTDSGAAATAAQRTRIASLATELEALYALTGKDPRTDSALPGDYRVSYTSSPQAAGGRFRSQLGRSVFKTRGLYQNVLRTDAAPVVVNRVEFELFGIPGAVGLSGPLRPVEPLRVAPRVDVVAGEGAAAAEGTGVRTFQGAVEVAFDAPFLEVAGSRVTLGGPSTVRLATTYLDSRLRVGRGGFGSLFVFERMPPGEQAAAAAAPTPAQAAAGWALARGALALFAALSLLVDAARLARRAATTPAVGVPAAMAALAAALTAGWVPLPPVLPPAPALAAAHLLAAATWLGATVWVTFGQGDVLFASMPRHAFSKLRAALRPRFLGASVAAGALALAAAAAAPQLQAGRLLQYALAAAAANMLWAEPQGTRLGAFRDKFEADAGIGSEVGTAPDEGKLTPTLRRLGVRIARLRAASAALTLVSIAALGGHLAALAARLV